MGDRETSLRSPPRAIGLESKLKGDAAREADLESFRGDQGFKKLIEE